MSFLKTISANHFFNLLIISQAVVSLSACSAFICCETKTENQSLELWLDSAVPCLLNKYNVPGTAMSIIRNGELVYSKGWGVKRIGEGAQINEQTIFPAASLTKPVFAYGAMMLVKDGRLDLDRSLSDYLDDPYIQGDDRLQKITARMVLSHTTGFPNWRPGRWTGSPKPLTIQFEPGTNFRYSGCAFNSETIQRLSAYDLEKMLRPQIELDNQLAWSLGWGLKEHGKEWSFWQWGDNPGFKHFAVGSRSQQFALIVFTNGQNGKSVYQDIIEAVLNVRLND